MTWIRASSVPEAKSGSSPRKVEVNGSTIVVGMIGDRPFAFEASCPHKGGPLNQGELIGDRIRCPWHEYEFNVFTGQVVAIPYPEKYGEWRKTGNLRTYQVRVVQGDVYLDV